MQGQHRLHDMSQPSHGPVYSSGSIPGASAHLSSSMLSQSSHASSTAHSSSVAADVPVKSSRDRKRTSAVQETKEHLSKNRSRTKNPLRVTRTADESEAVDDGSDDDAGDQGMSQPLAEDQALSAAADGNLAHGIGAQSPAEADEAGKHNNSMEGSDALGPYDSVDLGDAIEGTNDAGHDDRGSAVDPLAVGGRMTTATKATSTRAR
ncbi:uncharacterized protein BJ171DRAFT_519986 [Polychytrium aggregatum]|uniref:uncharacterized protein n=1 Tax=Polychytrium aggregatum TaxID=110093 RepID=UPI0022FE2770|nr:uncharacterized protein BJ171DRAFT_519986 [Polychytrium aggregatum]KAI9197344.1 hypothetical protein BJ171DRAFT_519986 [Polychytrium aggregatum]